MVTMATKLIDLGERGTISLIGRPAARVTF